MVRCVCGDKPRLWDTTLPLIEFSFNSLKNHSTKKSPFKVVYTKPPRHTLDLVDLLKVPLLSQAVEQLAKRIQRIQASNQSYKASADVHRRKEFSRR